MDTFMDKLAQRFTAQEMIKANTAADAEEMYLLKEQVKEYSDCLNRMQEICKQMEQTAEDMQARIEAVEIDGEDIDRVVEAGLTKIRQIQQVQQDTGVLDTLRSQIEEMKEELCTADDLAAVSNAMQETSDDIAAMSRTVQDVQEALQTVQGNLDEMQKKLEDMERKNSEQDDSEKSELDEKLEAVTESVHKECVKVYRNVQAVINEENTKRAESMNEMLKGERKKISSVLGVSIAALIVSVAGVALQVLGILHII